MFLSKKKQLRVPIIFFFGFVSRRQSDNFETETQREEFKRECEFFCVFEDVNFILFELPTFSKSIFLGKIHGTEIRTVKNAFVQPLLRFICPSVMCSYDWSVCVCASDRNKKEKKIPQPTFLVSSWRVRGILRVLSYRVRSRRQPPPVFLSHRRQRHRDRYIF